MIRCAIDLCKLSESEYPGYKVRSEQNTGYGVQLWASGNLRDSFFNEDQTGRSMDGRRTRISPDHGQSTMDGQLYFHKPH